jgi:hypothetical protein
LVTPENSEQTNRWQIESRAHFDPYRRRKDWWAAPEPRPEAQRAQRLDTELATLIDTKIAEAIEREREEIHGVLAELLAQIQDEVHELRQNCARDCAKLESLVEVLRSTTEKSRPFELPQLPTLRTKPLSGASDHYRADLFPSKIESGVPRST